MAHVEKNGNVYRVLVGKRAGDHLGDLDMDDSITRKWIFVGRNTSSRDW